jgi:peroxiredoxin
MIMTDNYNYDAFDANHYALLDFKGPEIGEPAPDFSAQLLDGQPVKLSDYLESLTVLEMGSITCPIYQSRLKGMNNLATQYPEIPFLVLYVREAHPGERICQHRSEADKQSRATELEQEFGETRTILIDDLNGSAHTLFGSMPNSVFIIDGSGIVVYRSDWNDVAATEVALQRLLLGKSADKVRSYFKPATPWIAKEVFRHAGKGSARDFFRSFPTLIRQNIIIRNIRQLLRR